MDEFHFGRAKVIKLSDASERLEIARKVLLPFRRVKATTIVSMKHEEVDKRMKARQPIQRELENFAGQFVGRSSIPSTFVSTEKSMRQKSSRGVNSGYTDSSRSLVGPRCWLALSPGVPLVPSLAGLVPTLGWAFKAHYTEKMDEGNIDREAFNLTTWLSSAATVIRDFMEGPKEKMNNRRAVAGGSRYGHCSLGTLPLDFPKVQRSPDILAPTIPMKSYGKNYPCNEIRA
ncbi:hypothetical protein V1478_013836 [Vespula squamosa]|uniref:Uncharacterized protein n=1 Tax=Vespula squamosa TaxID=30214 RepID=A0ABD2A6D3_VESSQ